MTCSDNDHKEWATATRSSRRPAATTDATTPALNWNRKVHCRKQRNGRVTCSDNDDMHDDFHVQCHKDKQGRTVCKDSDGEKQFCRVVRGKMTCSDNDHSDWWAQEVIETRSMMRPTTTRDMTTTSTRTSRPATWWNRPRVHCRKNRVTGEVSCTDNDDVDDDFHVQCRKDTQGRTIC